LTIEAGEQLKLTGLESPPLFIALDKTQAEATANGNAAETLTDGKVLAPAPGTAVDIRNTGKTAARFLVFEFK
jgi:hypothetical protein